MNQNYWKDKIFAYLHDPPEKPIILFTGSSHEKRANEIVKNLGIGEPDKNTIEQIKLADYIASGIDRPLFTKLEGRINFLKDPEIIHPLSGEKFDEKLFVPIQRNNIIDSSKEAVNTAIEELRIKANGDAKNLYLLLWRFLPEEIIEVEKPGNKLGFLWRHLPADTRLPYHSVFAHLTATSAIYSSLQMGERPAFLFFSLGPVQSFISTSRKTQDLWSSSLLLSYLSWKGMEVIAEELGPDHIMFPYLKKQPMVDMWLKEKGLIDGNFSEEKMLNMPSLPNRFLAVIPYEMGKEVGDKVMENIRNEWMKISQVTFEHYIKEPLKEVTKNYPQASVELFKKMWDEQVNNFLEMNYVVFPWTDGHAELEALPPRKTADSVTQFTKMYNYLLKEIQDSKNQDKLYIEGNNIGAVYGSLYEVSERFLGARKSVRNFEQSEQKGEKCTLCGVNSALIPFLSNIKLKQFRNAEIFPRRSEYREFWKSLAKEIDKKAGAKGIIKDDGSERLCAVGLIKRFFGRNVYSKIIHTDISVNFPSTASIAISSFLYEASKSERGKEFLSDFKQSIKSIDSEKSGNYPDEVYRTLENVDSDLPEHDGHFYYISELEGLKKEDNARKEEIEDAVKFMQDLKEENPDLYSKITPYFSVIQYDGDRMGKWLSGGIKDYPILKDVLHSKVGIDSSVDTNWTLKPSAAIHSSISRNLRDFSLKIVPEVVERNLGKLIYSGGDDVLAFVPLDYSLDFATHIRKLYSGLDLELDGRIHSKNGFIAIGKDKLQPEDLYTTMGGKATGSAGIVFAHYSTPLSYVLQKAREAEHEAKEAYGRNAFVIKIIRSSGQESSVGGKWFYQIKKENDKIVLSRTEFIQLISKFFDLKGIKYEDIKKFGFFEPYFNSIENVESISLSPSIISDLRSEYLFYTYTEGEENNEREKAVKNTIDSQFKNRIHTFLVRHINIEKVDTKKKLEREKVVNGMENMIFDFFYFHFNSLVSNENSLKKAKEDKYTNALKGLIEFLTVSRFIAKKGGE